MKMYIYIAFRMQFMHLHGDIVKQWHWLVANYYSGKWCMWYYYYIPSSNRGNDKTSGVFTLEEGFTTWELDLDDDLCLTMALLYHVVKGTQFLNESVFGSNISMYVYYLHNYMHTKMQETHSGHWLILE